MKPEQFYMKRCLDLAIKGSGYVAPNPMVGAVLVHNNHIIGEGWHKIYGDAHAEVNCLRSVKQDDQHLITQSILYVSLEPCAHYGKTPPCADLIIQSGIPEVVIGCRDPFSEVSGKGIQKLQQAGVKVTVDVLREECRWLNRRFFMRQEQSRPYIILKWACSADGFIAPENGRRVMLSNPYSLLMTHRMRAEEDAILVGFRTALLDNPRLSNRYGQGRHPCRLLIDPELQIEAINNLFDQAQPCIVFNYLSDKKYGNISWIKLNRQEPTAPQITSHLDKLGISSVIIEGGAKTLSLFITSGLWDECIQIRTPHIIGSGVAAPSLKDAFTHERFSMAEDSINIFYSKQVHHLLEQ